MSDPKKHQPNPWMKYSGMAFQLMAAGVIGMFLGKWIDGKMMTSKPYFTALCAIVFLGAALFSIVKDILKNK